MVTTTTGLATSFITFTRTSNATVTDSNGFIKWAGHNLLTNSESFDGWTTNYGVTVTANAIAAPNGTTTADRLVEQAINDTHFIGQNDRITTPSNTLVPHTLAVFAKADQRQYLNLSIEWSTNYVAATFDLSGGTVTSNRAGGTGTGNTSTITPVGSSGWYLCTLTGILGTAGSNGAVISISNVAVPTGSKASYLGNTSNGLYLWGAHLYRSDLGGMVLNPARGDAYYPTTPRNLLGYTEDFSAASWSRLNVSAIGSGSIANAAVAPNGLQTADKIVASASSGVHILYSTTSIGAGTYVYSIYAKAAEYSLLRISEGSTGFFYASFDLASGAVVAGTTGGTKYISSAISSIGSGWYRCSVVFSNVGTNVLPAVCGYPSGATLTGYSAEYTGDGVSGIYLWGAQLSDSASLDAYSPVYGAAVTSAAYYAPRLDFDPVTLAAKGLLVEEQRTNFIVNSNSPIASTGTTITASAAISPDGTQSAYRIAKTDATTPRYISRNTGSMTTVGGRTYTVSTWFKYDGHDVTVSLEYNSTANWDLSWIALFSVTSTGVTTLSASSCTQFVQDVGNGWYRAIVTFTNGPSPSVTSNPTVLTRIDGGSGVSVLGYGGQIEELAAFPTSYIPTGASSATRTADVASVSTQAFPYSASEGTLVGEVRGLLSNTITQVPLVSFGDANNRIELRAVGDPFTYNRAVVVNSGSTVVDINATGLPASASATRKVGFAFKLNDFATTGTGGTVGTTSSGTIPSVSVMNIGTAPYASTVKTNGWIARITYIPRRLSNSELQARTV